MMKTTRRPFLWACTAIAGMIAFGGTSAVATAAIEPPVQIGSSSAYNATMGIPRWKGWMHPDGPDTMWASFANADGDGNNIVHTRDGGLTWSTEQFTPDVDGGLNYHASLFGAGGDLYFTFPDAEGIGVRHIAAPAMSNADREPLAIMAGTTPWHRSNVMVDGNGRVWVFTRRGDVLGENVRYHYSDDQGRTWTDGVAVATGAPNVRVGSMPYVDGRACLVVLHLDDPRGYEYYLWNGTAFEAMPDHVIRAGSVGYSRSFSHNVTGGRTFHLVFARTGQLYHVWKDFDGGTGTWHEEVIDSSAVMDDMEWSPILTVRGDELYLFFSRHESTVAASHIYLRRWTTETATWGPAELVSTGGLTQNVHPNTCFAVPPTADYIPVFWTSGPAQDSVQFVRVTLDTPRPPDDDTPPSKIEDLNVYAQDKDGQVEVTWTAPGDDLDQGIAASYDVRYSVRPITEATWESAFPLAGEPLPAAAGTRQYMTIHELQPGEAYLIGIRARDDAGNDSDLSNIIWLKVGELSAAGQVPDGRARLQPNYPNPFNPSTTLRFSLPHAGRVRLTIYDGAGRLVKRVLGDWRGAGDHEVRWNGRDRQGRAVASGTYYSRLEFEDVVTTGALTLVR